MVTNLDDITSQLNALNDKIQSSNNEDLLLIGVSLFIATIAIAFTVYQAIYLRRQVLFTERETEVRLQSWLVIEELMPVQVELTNGAIDLYEDWSKVSPAKPAKQIKFHIKVKNIGLNVARNISDKTIVKDEKFSRELFEKEEEGTLGTINVMAPNSDYSVEIPMTFDRFKELGTKPMFAGISVSYDGPRDRKYSGIIYELKRGTNVIVDSWMV